MPLISFLRRPLRRSWTDDSNCILTGPSFDFENSTFTGAAYRGDGSLILESLRPSRLGHWRHVDPITISYESFPTSENDLELAIYGGHFFEMWGHFLFETLATAADAVSMPHCPVVFLPFAKGGNQEGFMNCWKKFAPLLAAAGWGSRPLVLQSSAMHIDRLIIPERLSVYAAPVGDRSATDDMAKIYRSLRECLAPGVVGSRIVVACRPSWTVRQHPAEQDIYEALAKAGCFLADCVTLSSVEQAKIFASASAIVGFAGSNLHNSVFCHEHTPVLEIGDARSYASGPDHRNNTQITICGVLQQPLIFVESFTKDLRGLSPMSSLAVREGIERILSLALPQKTTCDTSHYQS